MLTKIKIAAAATVAAGLIVPLGLSHTAAVGAMSAAEKSRPHHRLELVASSSADPDITRALQGGRHHRHHGVVVCAVRPQVLSVCDAAQGGRHHRHHGVVVCAVRPRVLSVCDAGQGGRHHRHHGVVVCAVARRCSRSVTWGKAAVTTAIRA
jgi:hypothetical protein